MVLPLMQVMVNFFATAGLETNAVCTDWVGTGLALGVTVGCIVGFALLFVDAVNDGEGVGDGVTSS